MKNFAFIALLFANSIFAQDDGAFLDSKYQHLVHPKQNLTTRNKGFSANDVKSIINLQTPVRSQMARGTCSIFSATAYLESLLIKKGIFNNDINLSEEWLQYTSLNKSLSDGSSAPANFNAIASFGMTNEESYPYIGEDWVKVFNPLKDVRCGNLTGNFKTTCLIIHRDPSLLRLTDGEIQSKYSDKEFVLARSEAIDFKSKYISFSKSSSFYINDVSEAKGLLLNGMPIILELDFYYGAWNHREADTFGIGRDIDQWSKGIVAYPEENSVDLIESRKHPAGHSVLLVGYDDNKIVEKTIKMQDGTTKRFTYKGVYYFKNSWGKSSFGAIFEINGEQFPGYGMVVQKYANEFGAFFKMPLK